MVQAYTRGYLASLEEIREAVRSSVKVRAYEPRGGEDRWQEAFEKLRGVMETVPRLDREGAST
jgi:hypothetical protein